LPQIESLIFIAVAVISPFIGSFFNVLIYRLPRGEEVVVTPSHCPKCGHKIRWYDNIPILSWLLLSAKCRDCRKPISFRYPLIEALTSVLFIVTYKLTLSAGYSVPASILLVACSGVLLLVLIIDIETYLIPDQLIWWGIVLSIVLITISSSPAGTITSAIIGFFSLSLVLIIIGAIANSIVFPATYKKERGLLVLFPWLLYLITYIVAYPIEHFRGINKASPDEVLDAKSATAEESAMGGGDIKLAAFMGLLLGWQLLLAAFAIAITAGGFLAAIMLIAKRYSGDYEKGLKLQFGPFLAIGTYVALFFGHQLIAWYLRTTGIAP
jgi:leader peptidase (prepilin peptidase) / N-methyltransferase